MLLQSFSLFTCPGSNAEVLVMTWSDVPDSTSQKDAQVILFFSKNQ